MPGAVDTAADVVDICGNSADGGSQLFLLGVIELYDVPINQHLAGVCAEIMRSLLTHLVLNEIQFLLIQADFFTAGPCAV